MKVVHSTKRPRERAFLVGTELKSGRMLFSVDESLAELERLAETAGLDCVGRTSQRFDHPDSKTYIGMGKLDEVRILAQELDANVILFDDELSPRHQREIEKALGEKNKIKVLDRTALILDIFAQHAQTHEGKLQVELAQLEYRLPRLTRMWTHLARQSGGQTGGSVGLRGPGEKQIESDRREIGRRITGLKSEIETVRQRRKQHRRKRQQTELQVVAIVGYTNAGKSTLLNSLSGAGILAEDKLFATLDPTTRRVKMLGGREVLLTDTVGFIQKLPTDIVTAFRATLEEIVEADVILHVVDVTHPSARAHIEVVKDTLAELDVSGIPTVMALNKIDLLPEGVNSWDNLGVSIAAVPVSAHTGDGMRDLLVALEAAIEEQWEKVHLLLPYDRGDLLSLFHERGQIDQIDHGAKGIKLNGRLPNRLVPYFIEYQYDEKLRSNDNE